MVDIEVMGALRSRWWLSLFFMSTMLVASCKGPASPSTANSQQKITTPPITLPETVSTAPTPTPTVTEPVAVEETPKPVETTDYDPTTSKAPTNLLLLVDASGSMNGPMGGSSKLDHLKEILKTLIFQPQASDVERRLGLRVFGSDSLADEANCSDSRNILKLSTVDATTLATQVDTIKAQGGSPLAYALTQAEEDFSASGANDDNIVVLITDGQDSCGMDPCDVVSKFKKDRHIIVHTIGFDLDSESASKLECLSTTTQGQFFLARNVNELRNAVEQAVLSNTPYNLKLRVLAGATPLPAEVTVFRSGTNQVVKHANATGTLFLNMPPGAYDIMIEYIDSPERQRPKRVLKGVELTASTKAEQTIQFDLGSITLSSTGEGGTPTKANYYIYKSGDPTLVAEFTAGPDPSVISITPGKYDIQAIQINPDGLSLTAVVQGLTVDNGGMAEYAFKFQSGKLRLKAQIQPAQFIPFEYVVTQAGESETVIAKGAAENKGIILEIPPGRYDLYVTPSNPNIKLSETYSITNLDVAGGETYGRLASLPAGKIVLTGKDSKGRPVLTTYSIKKTGSTEELATATSNKEPLELYLTPGQYDILALNTGSNLTPAPSILWSELAVKVNESITQNAVFEVGELRLIGKNLREQRIPTSFTVYRAGSTDEVATLKSDGNWISFYLTPGLYSIKAVDSFTKSEPKPTTWLHDVMIQSGTTESREAIFTSGKIKLGCRGENNILLICTFKLYEYGSDSATFSGTTDDNWREYDIAPGKYYLEAGYHDPQRHQYLKKWINVSVDENEVVELVMRF